MTQLNDLTPAGNTSMSRPGSEESRTALINIGMGMVAASLFVVLLAGCSDNTGGETQADGMAAEDSASDFGDEEVIEDIPGDWDVDYDASSLTVTYTYEDEPYDATFENWTAAIQSGPEDLANASAVVTVDLTSVKTVSSFLDDTARSRAWLDTGSTPTAVFEVASFQETAPGSYEADATLTMKGKTLPVTLPFTATIDEGVATVEGETTLDRTAFEAGAPGGDVGDTITVSVSLVASRIE